MKIRPHWIIFRGALKSSDKIELESLELVSGLFAELPTV